MQLTNLFTNDEADRAVSPVIGVILMVAITVILAAVIGTFVLGLGDQVQQTSPNAQWSWDEPSGGGLEVTHESGQSIDVARLEMNPAACTWSGLSDSKVTAGATCTISSPTDGETYKLIWTAEDGSQSTTLTEYTYEA